jgi:tetratricopeptide (TPR) repeat protein
MTAQLSDTSYKGTRGAKSDGLRRTRSDLVGYLFMKPVFAIALIMGYGLAAAPSLRAQSPQNNQQSTPPAPANQNSQPAQQPSRSQQQTNQNPFPEDTGNVPLMPSRDNPNPPSSSGDETRQPIYLPEDDVDPVRSPEEAGAAAEAGESSSSSSLAGVGNLLPPPDDDTVQPGKHGKKGSQIAPEHQETAAEDENVGAYYLDNKDWKAALSRFESALVLDPDNPDVYWGLAESQRHLGNLAEARANYQKVVDYDPDSRHGKDARKALKDPEIANAKASVQPAATQAAPHTLVPQ